jgi:Carboxypeptidase regulatory-like domain
MASMKADLKLGATAAMLTFCLLISSRATGQRPRPDTAQPSSLQGRVVKWGTAEPIAKATVELRPVEASGPPPYVAMTTTDGTFAFGAVRAGQYRIVVTRPGYVTAEYGQRWPNGAGTPLTIPPGQSVSNVPIPMLMTAAISGRIRDGLGQPIGNVEVQVLRATYRDGRRELTRVDSAVSDDRGEYRLFWLAPGRYYLSARHPDVGGGLMRMSQGIIGGGGATGPTGPIQFQEFRSSSDGASAGPIVLGPAANNLKERYMPVYFPGTTDEHDASSIDLGPGAEQNGMDFVLEPVPMRRIRGRVVYESNGEPATAAHVQWVSSTGASSSSGNDDVFSPARIMELPHTVQCCNGAFELALAPGSYTIVAAVNNLIARADVQVGNGDVDGVLLSLGQGFNVTGRVTFEGRQPTPAELNALRFSLAMNPPVPGLTPSSYSVVLPNGSLTLNAGRGNFRINVAPLLNVPGASLGPPRPGSPTLQGLYVKSIKLGDADALNDGLHLDGRPDVPLEVVIGTTPGSVEGVVMNQNGQPVPNVTVSLLPDVARRGRLDLYRTASSDARGRFKIEQLPPGDYVAFAWDGFESGEWQNPEFVAPYEARGTRVRVRDSAPTTVEVSALTP